MPIYNVGLEVTINEVVTIVADSPEEAEKIAEQEGWTELTCGICCWEITEHVEVALDSRENRNRIPKGPIGTYFWYKNQWTTDKEYELMKLNKVGEENGITSL